MAVVEGNRGDGCSGTKVAGDSVREGSGGRKPHGTGLVIESFGGGVACRVLAGGGITGSVGESEEREFFDAPVGGGGACGGFESEVAIGLGRGEGESVET